MKTMKRLLTTIIVALSLNATVAHAELITNGGFETGNFNGWTAVSNNGTSGCGVNLWVVNATGTHGCNANGTVVAAPTSGTFAAFNTFDGALANYMMSQTVNLPGSIGGATLSFMNEFRMSYSGLPRSFMFDLYDATNTTLLSNLYLETVGFQANVSWTNHSVDVTSALAAHAGNAVTLRFTQVIPAAYSGPAGFGIDNISLVTVPARTDVPEPASLALLGLGLVGLCAARRKAVKK